MTAHEFSRLLETLEPLGLNTRRLAAIWGYASHTSIRQMAEGKQAVPPEIAAWLRLLAAWWDRYRPR